VERLHLRLQILATAGGERRADVHMDRNATVAELKARHFGDEIAEGCRLRCVFLGRLLGDGEAVAQLPSGSVLQCYLQRPQGAAAGAEQDALLPPWARLSSSGQPIYPLCPKWQDLAFHSVFAAGLAVAWAAYLADPAAVDAFGRFALRFFSLAWVVVCSADLIRPQAPPGPRVASSPART